jgi:hypothetical protein
MKRSVLTEEQVIRILHEHEPDRESQARKCLAWPSVSIQMTLHRFGNEELSTKNQTS